MCAAWLYLRPKRDGEYYNIILLNGLDVRPSAPHHNGKVHIFSSPQIALHPHMASVETVTAAAADTITPKRPRDDESAYLYTTPATDATLNAGRVAVNVQK